MKTETLHGQIADGTVLEEQATTSAFPATVKRWISAHPDIGFWSCFLLLNGLLFAPFYLLNRESSTLWPVLLSDAHRPVAMMRDLLLWRANYDPFRFNLELSLLVVAWVFVKRVRGRVFFWLLFGAYLFALVYYSYEAIMIYLYKVEPVIYNQLHLFTEGLIFLLRHLHLPIWLYAVALLLIMAAVAVVLYLVRGLTLSGADRRLSKATRVGIGALALACGTVAILFQSSLASPEMVVSSLTLKAARNATESLRIYDEVRSFDDSHILALYDYDDYVLEQKPDIYLVFIESYGSVLYKRPDFDQAYRALLVELEDTLADAGWDVTSALSDAPTWGGGSWLSYTSALFGLPIDNHPQFLSMLNRYQYADFPDLGSYLKGQGYRYYRLSSLSAEMRDDVWLRYKNFFGVDEWFRYSDLGFVGPEYGWGPAPPDQYALGFAHQAMDTASDDPSLFFFITQNSHYPWAPLPAIAQDWRTLNAPGDDPVAPNPELIDHQVRRQNYLDAVEYQLRFLTDFIVKHGDQDAIFVLVGDHQPPRVSRRSDGFDTPIHVISRDGDFVSHFEEFGFAPGLSVADPVPAMRHVGLYSMLMRVLVGRYGADEKHPPAYLPDGVRLSPGSAPQE